jgi:hypothetical protein
MVTVAKKQNLTIKERFSQTFPALEEQKIVLVNKTTRSEIPQE